MAIKFETKSAATGDFAAVVTAAILAFFGQGTFTYATQAKEKRNGDYDFREPIGAFIRFLKSLGSGENSADRKAMKARLEAAGKTPDEIEAELRKIRRTRENYRTCASILQRIHGHNLPDGATQIVLTVPMENKLISLLKAATGYREAVGQAELSEAINALSEVFTKVEGSTLTFDSLGLGSTPIPARAMTAGAKATA